MNLKRIKIEEAQEMTRKAADKMLREVYEQREEIMKAFVAKHGFEPDECQQVIDGSKFYLIRLDPERVTVVRDNLIRSKLHMETQRFTFWQRLCLKMAGWK